MNVPTSAYKLTACLLIFAFLLKSHLSEQQLQSTSLPPSLIAFTNGRLGHRFLPRQHQWQVSSVTLRGAPDVATAQIDAGPPLPRTSLLDPLLTAQEVGALLEARAIKAASCQLSVDLGVSYQTAELYPEGFGLGGKKMVLWEAIEKLEDKSGCFRLVPGPGEGDWGYAVEKVTFFSEETHRVASLLPTGAGWPTALLSGFSMHRFGKGVDPKQDTENKLAGVRPLLRRGVPVLDICTGLGYTAILAAKLGAEVTTIEKDPVMQQLCRLNPWSQGLYDDATGSHIRILMGDASEVVKGLPSKSFKVILHDPPSFSLGEPLFSEAFYGELLRILAPGGLLYHYVGDPSSKLGSRDTAIVTRNLKAAGFHTIVPAAAAYGLLAAPGHISGASVAAARRPDPSTSKRKKAPPSGGRVDWQRQLELEQQRRREEYGDEEEGSSSQPN